MKLFLNEKKMFLEIELRVTLGVVLNMIRLLSMKCSGLMNLHNLFMPGPD